MNKRVFPQNYIIQILSILIMYGFIGYYAVIAGKQYYVIAILLAVSFYFLNCRLYIGENNITVIQNIKKVSIEIAEIESLKIVDHKPRLSSVSVPAILITCHNGEKKIFLYKQYPKRTISELINYIKMKNKEVSLCGNIKSLLKNEVSEFDRYKQKQNRTTFIIMIAIILIVLYVKFR